MPVGDSDSGVGLESRQISVNYNFLNQHINWWHAKMDNSEPQGINPEEHQGNLSTRMHNLSFNFGVNSYMNVSSSFLFGSRHMDFLGGESIHHRDEGFSGYVQSQTMLKILLENDTQGRRIFAGVGLIVPTMNTSNQFQENPYALSDQLKEHTHFALSDGNLKAVFTFEAFNRTKKSLIFGTVSTLEKSIKKSASGLKVGNLYNAFLYTFLHHAKINQYVTPYLALNYMYQSQSKWDNYDGVTISPGGILNIGGGFKSILNNNTISVSFYKSMYERIDVSGEGSYVESSMDSYNISVSIGYLIS